MRTEYLIGEAAANLRRNLLLAIGAILAVFISLLMTYAAIIVGEITRTTTLQWQEGVTIIGYLHEADLADHSAVVQEAESWPEVESATYFSKAQAYEEFKELFANRDRWIELVEPAKIPASVRIVLADTEAHREVVDQLAREPTVRKVVSPEDNLNDVLTVSRFLNFGAILLGATLGVSALVLIANTVRMAIYARREEIGIMKLVGASNWFVRTPFLLEGLFEGLLGAGLAVAVGWLGYEWLLGSFDIGVIETSLPTSFLLSRGMLVLLFGGVVGVLGSAVGLRRWLKES